MAKRGQPAKYQERYCDALINHMAEGLAYESFAGEVGVHRDTLYNWEKLYPDFSDAKKVGTELSYLFWDKLGVRAVQGKIQNFNATAYIFNMKNRFGWDNVRPENQKQDNSEVIAAVTEIGQKVIDATARIKGKVSER